MTEYTDKIVNPVSGRIITVGGKAYKDLIKTGKLPNQTIVVKNGVKCVAMSQDAPVKTSKFPSKKAKEDALRQLKEKKDKEKRVKYVKEKEQSEAEELRRELYRQIQKKEMYKLKASNKSIPKSSAAIPKVKKEEEYFESTASSSSS